MSKQTEDIKVTKFHVVAFVAVVAAFVVANSYAIAHFRLNAQNSIRSTDYPGTWIRPAGDLARAGFFRKRFDLSGQVKHAWIKVAGLLVAPNASLSNWQQ